MTVLLTRPEPDSREIADELASYGLESLIWPLTRIVPTDDPIALPPGTDGLIVTSTNGLRTFADACPERGLPVLAVGDRTADAARAVGFEAESAGGDAEALAALARRSRLRHLFHPCGCDRAANLSRMLAPSGIEVTEQVVYAAEPTGPPAPAVAKALQKGAVRLATFWSTRNCSIFKDLSEDGSLGELQHMTAVAISPRAAHALDGCGFGTILVSDRPDRRAMIRAIRTALAGRPQQS